MRRAAGAALNGTTCPFLRGGARRRLVGRYRGLIDHLGSAYKNRIGNLDAQRLGGFHIYC